MIDLYTWLTPNGRKISLMLEETQLSYKVYPVDISAGEQFAPSYLKINPSGKIPAIVDHEGPGERCLSLFESGAILVYLARKAGQFLPSDEADYWCTIQWLHVQVASVGPMLGQVQHFVHYAPEKIPYAIQRYEREARRLYSVLDNRLSETQYLAGNDYTIADIATWPWIKSWKIQGIQLEQYPNVMRWFASIEQRPAVLRERKVLADRRNSGPLLRDARLALFGSATENGAPNS